MKRALPALFLVACFPSTDPVYGGNREPLETLPLLEGEGALHEVHAGESLYRIAKTYGISLEELVMVNDVMTPDRIEVGATLFIPRATEVRVVPPPEPKAAREEAIANAEVKELVRDKAGKLDWPVDGIVTSRFGARGQRKHDGIDISAPAGTKIVAAEAGTVLYAGSEQRGYGNMIIVKHDGGLVTIYAHNRENIVKEGEKVFRGQTIGLVGQTGRADGPHVHFEVRQLDKARNPLLYLP